MARLCLTVEGQAEQGFAIRVLRPHLADRGVFLTGVRLTSLGRKKGRTHRGGVARYPTLKKDIENWMKEDRAGDVFFTTMIDLYGLPRDFPGYRDASSASDPYERIAGLELALREDLGDRRFIPYLQLHEFEALLFSDPSALKTYYGEEYAPGVEGLARVVASSSNPELIDDGERTAPSKRIGIEIPRYLREKASAGPLIAAQIGLDVIRSKCRHFREWLAKLEALGASSGEVSSS